MLIDSHAHIYDEEYGDGGAEKIISSMSDDGLEYIVCVGCDIPSSETCVRLATEHKNIYAVVGVHPYDADKVDERCIARLRALAANNKVVAIGEFGLDFHREGSDKTAQLRAVELQYELARELNLPVVIHLRDGYGEFMEFARNREFPDGGVLHCFSGSKEVAEYFLKKNFYISFSGTVTYKNAVNIVRAAEAVPIDRLLVETDSPYLTPVPLRGQINHPRNVRFVARKLAEIKGVSYELMEKTTAENAKKAFGING